MYGVGENFETVVEGSPANPIGPDLQDQNDWWFRFVLLTRSSSPDEGWLSDVQSIVDPNIEH